MLQHLSRARDHLSGGTADNAGLALHYCHRSHRGRELHWAGAESELRFQPPRQPSISDLWAFWRGFAAESRRQRKGPDIWDPPDADDHGSRRRQTLSVGLRGSPMDSHRRFKAAKPAGSPIRAPLRRPLMAIAVEQPAWVTRPASRSAPALAAVPTLASSNPNIRRIKSRERRLAPSDTVCGAAAIVAAATGAPCTQTVFWDYYRHTRVKKYRLRVQRRGAGISICSLKPTYPRKRPRTHVDG
jgi:hypothetical protein